MPLNPMNRMLKDPKELHEEARKAFMAAGTDLGPNAGPMEPVVPGAVVWQVIERKYFAAEYAIIPQTEDISKIVFHVKRLSPNVMDRLSLYLCEEITRKMKPPAKVEAGHSPIYKDQWDLVLFHLPKFRAPMVLDAILAAMDKFSM